MDNTSKKYQLDKVDGYKMLRGLLVMLVGTVLTYFAAIYMQIDWTVHLGNMTLNLNAFLIPLFATGIEAGRRFLADNYNK